MSLKVDGDAQKACRVFFIHLLAQFEWKSKSLSFV
jgi:hypothetical protein